MSHSTIDEILPVCSFSLGNRFINQVPMGRQGADRVRLGGISGQCQSLTAAPAPVDFLAGAGGTGFRHPVRSPEEGEGLGMVPDMAERMIPDIIEMQGGDCFRCMAGKDMAGG